MSPAPDRPPRQGSVRWLMITALILVLLGGGYVAWRNWQAPDPTRQATPEAAQSQPPGTTVAKKTTADQQPEVAPAAQEKTAGDQPPDKGQAAQKKSLEPEKWGCKDVARRMRSFFSALDQQAYVQEYKLGVPAQQHLLDLTERLLRIPPVVAEEHSDIYLVLKNRAHLFRTIGLMNISLTKDILQHEQEQCEETAALFYRWTELGNCTAEQIPAAPALEQLYEYAVFFLNTLGGQSYLSRRDPRLRLLLTFYAVRIVDRANSAGSNRYGLDIRPFLDRLIEEVQSTSLLTDQQRHLDALLALQEKYQ